MLAQIKAHLTAQGTSVANEFTGGLATFLTLSYVFLLNPVLLAKTGMPIEAAFFGTVAASAFSTALMGLYAKAPFAIAPAPSITTFFVGYVCLELGLSWQTALGAVVLSGIVSMLMAQIGAKAGLIKSLPEGLKFGVIFALSGFLIASGLRQAGVIKYENSLIAFDNVSSFAELASYPGLMILLVGLLVTVILNLKPFKFRGSPIFGILVATAVAVALGVGAKSPTESFDNMFSAVGAFDFTELLSPSVMLSILILFIIDFFGGVGKFVGLQRMLKSEGIAVSDDKINKALMVDGAGNIVGGFVGASSLAVFISSAVGIKSGARTGLSALFCAFFMLLCLGLIPLVGAIPAEATAGVLVYIGFLLIPWKDVKAAIGSGESGVLNKVDIALGVIAALVSFISFSIDISLLIIFIGYSMTSLVARKFRASLMLYLVTLLLAVAVLMQ